MTTNLSQLSPTAVWQWFDQICAIPHPTFHEHALGDFIVHAVQTRGQQYGLTVKKDEKGNIIYDKKYPCYNWCMRFYYKLLFNKSELNINTGL